FIFQVFRGNCAALQTRGIYLTGGGCSDPTAQPDALILTAFRIPVPLELALRKEKGTERLVFLKLAVLLLQRLDAVAMLVVRLSRFFGGRLEGQYKVAVARRLNRHIGHFRRGQRIYHSELVCARFRIETAGRF